MPKPKANFTWDTERRAYRYETGRLVPSSRVEGWIDKATQNAEARMGRITEDLVAGKINVAAWQLQMKEEIKLGHRAIGMIANGGRAQMTNAAWGRIGSIVKAQNSFLDNFARQIENGDLQITAALITRAKMYGAALYPSFINGVKAREKAAGATEERSVLTLEDGWCLVCIKEAARGWIPIGELLPIGERTCLVRCRCGYETR